jgi:hypothetical protein
MNYTTDNNNAISIFMDGSEVPFMFQPDWPDGTPWASKKEAEDWAKAKIAELTIESAPMAGDTPSQPTKPKPTAEEVRLNKLSATGLTVDDLKALLGL